MIGPYPRFFGIWIQVFEPITGRRIKHIRKDLMGGENLAGGPISKEPGGHTSGKGLIPIVGPIHKTGMFRWDYGISTVFRPHESDCELVLTDLLRLRLMVA